MTNLKILFANILALLFLPIVAILLVISLALRIAACAFVNCIPSINKQDGWGFITQSYNWLANITEI